MTSATRSENRRPSLDFRTWIHDLFGTLVKQGGYRSPAALTSQLILLYDGANISAQMDHNPGAATDARDAAAALLRTTPRTAH